MARGLLDAIYWKLHSAYLLNERAEAEKFLAMALDEEKKEPRLCQEIGLKHYARFLAMKNSIFLGTFNRINGSGYEVPAWEGTFVEPGIDEKTFCSRLVGRRSCLMALIDASPESILAREVEMDPYGRCDFVMHDRAKRIAYGVEVKMGEAPTSVVSQIDKYRLCLELDMCLGLYDEVKAFVMAGAFPPYVSTELSRAEVGMIIHEGDPEVLRMLPRVVT